MCHDCRCWCLVQVFDVDISCEPVRHQPRGAPTVDARARARREAVFKPRTNRRH